MLYANSPWLKPLLCFEHYNLVVLMVLFLLQEGKPGNISDA